ncbi:hypothetical protein FXO38_23250 [Capsicum annuum]|nr:hypothetical protein FXO38_23250 [Capsicum annuum]
MEITKHLPFNSTEKSNGTQGPIATSISLETLMEIFNSASSFASKFTLEKNNYAPMSIEVTKVISSNFIYKKWSERESPSSSLSVPKNGEPSILYPNSQRTHSLHNSTTPFEQSSNVLGRAHSPWKNDHSPSDSRRPTDNPNNPRSSKVGPNHQGGSGRDHPRAAKPSVGSNPSLCQMMKTINMMNIEDLNSLMKHTFRSLPLYPTSSYLPSSPTLNPPVPEGENQSLGEPSTLKALKQNNQELEQILETFGEPSLDYFLFENPLLKEFSEHSSTVTIAHCLREMKFFSPILKNMGDNTPPIATVSPYIDQAQTPQVGKGKSLLA